MSEKKVNWLVTDHNITVNYEGQTHIVARTGELANKLIKALKEKRMDEIPMLISTSKRIEKYSDGAFMVRDGQILVNGTPAPEVLGNKILKFSNEGLPYEPLVRFAEKLQKNPSYRSVNQLFQFLEKNDHPITESGNFIAYKKVREDFKDVHSGTFDNSPGKVVEMPRNQVNEDPNQTCSNGLHVANWDYAANFYGGGVMLEVEVDPADVVAVPVDYNQAKMRTCRYKVLGVVDRASDDSLRYTDFPKDEEEDETFCQYCGDEDCSGECEDEYPYHDEIL